MPRRLSFGGGGASPPCSAKNTPPATMSTTAPKANSAIRRTGGRYSSGGDRLASGELAARRVDVAAAREPHGGAQSVLLERGPEGVDRAPARSVVDRVRRVVRDQVDLVDRGIEQLRELHRLRVAVVDAGEHHVLDEDLAALARVEALARGQHLAQRVALVDRHDLRAQRVLGRVKRESEPDRHVALGQAVDPRDPADRGDPRAAVRDADVGQPAGGGEHVVEVHQRLAHAHEHEVVERLDPPEMQHLVEDLGRGEVAAELHLAGRAERAGQRAARLRAHADRAPPVAVAHEHSLDRAPVGGLEERLDRAVGGVCLAHQRQRREGDLGGQARAQRCRQIGHLLVAGRARGRPAPHLPGAERRPAFQHTIEQLQVHASYGGSDVRLAKYLAHAGVASRRASEQIITAGRVTVDGTKVTDPARDVDESRAVKVDGKRVRAAQHVVYVLNKPAGVVSTAHDPQGRPTVVELVDSRERLYPVGRLDYDTTGLILLTNDGELAYRLTHPSFEVPRTYRARIANAPIHEPALRALRTGVELEDGPTAPAKVRRLASTHVELTIHEGRKRQVRRMLEAVGHPVRSLERVAFGPLRLGGLEPGEHRPLSAAELERLVECTATCGSSRSEAPTPSPRTPPRRSSRRRTR